MITTGFGRETLRKGRRERDRWGWGTRQADLSPINPYFDRPFNSISQFPYFVNCKVFYLILPSQSATEHLISVLSKVGSNRRRDTGKWQNIKRVGHSTGLRAPNQSLHQQSVQLHQVGLLAFSIWIFSAWFHRVDQPQNITLGVSPKLEGREEER